MSLFSDSTFVVTYSRSGAAFPNYKKSEMATGKFFNQYDSIYIIRNSIAEFIPDKYNLSRLEQVFGILPIRIEYSNDRLSLYNSAGIFFTFFKENVFEKYKNNKPVPLFSPVTYLSPRFSTNPFLF